MGSNGSIATLLAPYHSEGAFTRGDENRKHLQGMSLRAGADIGYLERTNKYAS